MFISLRFALFAGKDKNPVATAPGSDKIDARRPVVTALGSDLGDLDERFFFGERLCGGAFFSKHFYFFYKFFDNVVARNAAHWDAVLEDHADIAAKGNTELRIVRFAGAVYGTAHYGEMERFFDVSKPSFNLGHDLDKIINIQPPARRTGNDSHTAFS